MKHLILEKPLCLEKKVLKNLSLLGAVIIRTIYLLLIQEVVSSTLILWNKDFPITLQISYRQLKETITIQQLQYNNKLMRLGLFQTLLLGIPR